MLNYDKDFSKGEREYLKGQEMTKDRFDKLDSVGREEWKEECKSLSLETNWTRKIAKGEIKIAAKPKSIHQIEWEREFKFWETKLVTARKIFFWKKTLSNPRSINDLRDEYEKIVPFYKLIKNIKNKSIKPFLLLTSRKLAEMAK